jgi:hypothetical protein
LKTNLNTADKELLRLQVQDTYRVVDACSKGFPDFITTNWKIAYALLDFENLLKAFLDETEKSTRIFLIYLTNLEGKETISIRPSTYRKSEVRKAEFASFLRAKNITDEIILKLADAMLFLKLKT